MKHWLKTCISPNIKNKSLLILDSFNGFNAAAAEQEGHDDEEDNDSGNGTCF